MYFGNTLLNIAMTHSFSGLRVRTLTINSGDVPLSNMFGHVPPLSIKPCLDMTSFGNLLLLFIAMTHAGCGLKLYTVAINSGDVPPLKHVRERTRLPPVNQTLSRHDVIWQLIVTIYSDNSCRVWLKIM